MSTYAIGDIQGCFNELKNLLNHIHFDATKDTLWFTGDLINRGKQSLEVLRYIRDLGEQHKMVLGNHDLHLLAVYYEVQEPSKQDTINDILQAPDCDDLINWLRFRPLFHYDETLGYALAHAGLAPSWTLEKAKQLTKEVEAVLKSDSPQFFLQAMYGNHPDYWNDDLTGIARLRCITNYFTRLRLCYRDGRLDFTYKGTLKDKPAHLIPWFDVSNRANASLKIIFGHWAALGGKVDVSNVFALDTGCVWGNRLTALCLDNEKRFSIACDKL